MLRLFNLDSTYSHRQKFIGSLIKIDVSNVSTHSAYVACVRLSLVHSFGGVTATAAAAAGLLLLSSSSSSSPVYCCVR